jgi:hypothetical protein
MINYTEYSCQPVNETQFTKCGGVRFHTDNVNEKKPAWRVLLKIVALLAILPVGFALVVPLIPLPPLQACVVIAGVLLIYSGLAYFIRPEANTDNMGWLGGAMDDPFQYNDDLNRLLFKANCLLAPGRFVAHCIIDLLTLCNVIPEVSPEQAAQERASKAESQRLAREEEIKARAAVRQAKQQHGGTVALSSTQYLSPDRLDDG